MENAAILFVHEPCSYKGGGVGSKLVSAHVNSCHNLPFQKFSAFQKTFYIIIQSLVGQNGF